MVLSLFPYHPYFFNLLNTFHKIKPTTTKKKLIFFFNLFEWFSAQINRLDFVYNLFLSSWSKSNQVTYDYDCNVIVFLFLMAIYDTQLLVWYYYPFTIILVFGLCLRKKKTPSESGFRYLLEYNLLYLFSYIRKHSTYQILSALWVKTKMYPFQLSFRFKKLF